MTHLIPVGALLVDDELLLTLDIEDILVRGGIEVAAACATNAQALAWLASYKPFVAVIDFRLKDGTSQPVAKVLENMGVPTVVYSGNAYEADLHKANFGRFPWLQKPCEPDTLLAALHSVMKL